MFHNAVIVVSNGAVWLTADESMVDAQTRGDVLFEHLTIYLCVQLIHHAALFEKVGWESALADDELIACMNSDIRDMRSTLLDHGKAIGKGELLVIFANDKDM